VLKNDKRAIFTAAAHVQRAADYLHTLQRPTELGQGRLGGPLPNTFPGLHKGGRYFAKFLPLH
jgi:hypothetical protein